MESKNVREWVVGCWVIWLLGHGGGYMNDEECLSRSSNGGDVFFAAVSAAG